MVPKMLVLALFVGSAYAATFVGSLPMKPKEHAHKEGCYIKEINDVIPFGDSISPIGVCYQIACGVNAIDYASCGVAFSSDTKCHKTETDLSKPYADCCPTYKCETENEITNK